MNKKNKIAIAVSSITLASLTTGAFLFAKNNEHFKKVDNNQVFKNSLNQKISNDFQLINNNNKDIPTFDVRNDFNINQKVLEKDTLDVTTEEVKTIIRQNLNKIFTGNMNKSYFDQAVDNFKTNNSSSFILVNFNLYNFDGSGNNLKKYELILTGFNEDVNRSLIAIWVVVGISLTLFVLLVILLILKFYKKRSIKDNEPKMKIIEGELIIEK